ncbi:MAG: hypothetical protein HYR90_00835 [Candidatus Andersenbacteria bacterium]|nr:hypothetical protein [Candidatus Andersenbacteria bacterium]MBI3251206.1 hypothetical protein [Candidatus Andersenbacteria bacterium]
MTNRTVRILLLEDDIQTVAALTHYLTLLEEEMSAQNMDMSLVVLSEYSMVEEYINPDAKHTYDVVLLDRDCKMGGSFHALDFEKFGVENIIAISSTPQWNEEAQARSITRVVWKDYENIYGFADKVMREIRDVLKLPQPTEGTAASEPLFKQAVGIVRESGKASAALLQRRLRVGYARSARLLDLMEDEGVIGPAEGNEPRKIL